MFNIENFGSNRIKSLEGISLPKKINGVILYEIIKELKEKNSEETFTAQDIQREFYEREIFIPLQDVQAALEYLSITKAMCRINFLEFLVI